MELDLIKYIKTFFISFISLLFIGYFLQLFLSCFLESSGPLLNNNIIKLLNFILPGPSDFSAIIITTVESFFITLLVHLEKKK